MGSPRPGPLDDGLLPLSIPQREVWIDQHAWPGTAHLNIGGCGFLTGPLDIACVASAFRRLVADTDALRLVPLVDGRQRLLDRFEAELEVVDLRDAGDPAAAIEAWWKRAIRQPFVLGDAPPWRITLLRGRDDFHGVAIVFHHVVMDGWGTTIVIRRWSEIYTALAAGRHAPPADASPYATFVAESAAHRDSEAYRRSGAYWAAMMTPLPERLLLPRTHGGELHGLAAAHLASYPIRRDAYAALAATASGLGATPFVVFLAAIAIYFARIRNRPEIVVGVPSLNRSKRYRDTAGMFAGVLPIRIGVDPARPVAALLDGLGRCLRDALRHASYPLSEIGRNLQLIRQGRETLFDVLLSFERQNYDVRFGDAVSSGSRQLFSGIARYPLGITVCEFSDEQDIELALEGSADYFSDGDMALLGHRLWRLVETMLAAPAARIGDLDVLPPEELWAVVEGLHKDVAVHEQPPTFLSRFEHQAALRPEATALSWDFGSLDYQTLDRRANGVATRLLSFGVGRGDVVALAVPRSPDLIVGLLGITKSGAAFLPIDIDAPPERVRDILGQSQAVAVLAPDDLVERFTGLGAPCLDIDASLPPDDPVARDRVRPMPTDRAYVLFTSGSTGRPKGVEVDHEALARRLAWIAKAYAVEWHDRALQATQITFDPALIECLLPLVHGASVALPPPGRLRPESLATFAIAQGVTIMAFVPTTLALFLDGLGGRSGLRLRVACCGGEVLSPELAARFLRETGARLFNVYGPTEATIFATAWECEARDGTAPLPIGRPIDDTRVYVLDTALRPLPFGEPGEIWIGGSALARGYLNRPDLSAESFRPDPFLPEQRIYRTGDRGWIGNDNTLYFCGRIDRQVKLRGYRIELGEIEAVLQDFPGVDAAAVKLVEAEAVQQIHAWIGVSGSVDQEALKRHLRARLPDYMQPARLHALPALPRTDSEKIDYRRLDAVAAPTAAVPARPPATRLERELLTLWQDALNQPRLGVGDNFFEAGGDSLSAIAILAGIERVTGQRVSLYALTEHPTVERLAEALNGELLAARLLVRLGRPNAQGTPLYVAASGHGDLLRLQNFAKALGDGFDVGMLQPANGSSVATIRELATAYADRIAVRHAAPVCLAGFSVGGLTALETARILEERGTPVRALLLIDTVYPSRFVGGRRFWSALGWLAHNLHIQDLSMNGRRLEAMFNDPGLRLQVAALDGYQPGRFRGHTLLVKSTGLAGWDRWLFKPWRRLLDGRLQETVVQGLHGSLFETASAEQLADAFSSFLGRLPPVPPRAEGS